jgi:hypothetical protein
MVSEDNSVSIIAWKVCCLACEVICFHFIRNTRRNSLMWPWVARYTNWSVSKWSLLKGDTKIEFIQGKVLPKVILKLVPFGRIFTFIFKFTEIMEHFCSLFVRFKLEPWELVQFLMVPRCTAKSKIVSHTQLVRDYLQDFNRYIFHWMGKV